MNYNDFLTIADFFISMVSAAFSAMDEWEIIDDPYFSALDIILGFAFVGITIGFINRFRAGGGQEKGGD